MLLSIWVEVSDECFGRCFQQSFGMILGPPGYFSRSVWVSTRVPSHSSKQDSRCACVKERRLASQVSSKQPLLYTEVRIGPAHVTIAGQFPHSPYFGVSDGCGESRAGLWWWFLLQQTQRGPSQLQSRSDESRRSKSRFQTRGNKYFHTHTNQTERAIVGCKQDLLQIVRKMTCEDHCDLAGGDQTRICFRSCILP